MRLISEVINMLLMVLFPWFAYFLCLIYQWQVASSVYNVCQLFLLWIRQQFVVPAPLRSNLKRMHCQVITKHPSPTLVAPQSMTKIVYQKYFLKLERGARKLTGENLKVVRAFNCKLGCFASYQNKCTAHIQAFLKLKTRPRFCPVSWSFIHGWS